MRVEICAIEGGCDLGHLTASDIAYIEALPSAKRRREVSAWRALLRKTLREEGVLSADCDIEYSSVGAPRLVGGGVYFSVSHCSLYVAIITSRESPCAVDIEDCSRSFEGVARRYTTQCEVDLIPDRELALPIIWSAKEALYKVSGREGLDFLADITIEECVGDRLVGRVGERCYDLRYFTHLGHIVVCTL